MWPGVGLRQTGWHHTPSFSQETHSEKKILWSHWYTGLRCYNSRRSEVEDWFEGGLGEASKKGGYFTLRLLERCEKDQNCKLQFPQPDYWPPHSPDFRTVFGTMIGPFSFCEIGKTWGTNKKVKKTNKQKLKWKIVSGTRSDFSEVRKSSESGFFLLSKRAFLVPETKMWDLFWNLSVTR